MFDVAMMLAGAAVASQIRFDYLAQSGFYRGVRRVCRGLLARAVSRRSASIESWRGRSKLVLAGRCRSPG